MKTIEEKAFEYCKKEICPTCSDNKTCIKTNRIGDCIPTYMEYEAFIAGYNAALENTKPTILCEHVYVSNLDPDEEDYDLICKKCGHRAN